MSDKVFIDTTVLIYAVLLTNPRQCGAVGSWVRVPNLWIFRPGILQADKTQVSRARPGAPGTRHRNLVLWASLAHHSQTYESSALAGICLSFDLSIKCESVVERKADRLRKDVPPDHVYKCRHQSSAISKQRHSLCDN